MRILIGEGGDDFVCLFCCDCDYSELIFDGMFFDIFEYIWYLGAIIVVDKNTAHKSTCFLIDIDAYIFGESVLVECFLDVLVGEAAVDALDVETAKLLQF